MGILEKLIAPLGITGALLAVAVVTLWRRIEAENTANRARIKELEAELKAMQKEQLRDAQEFLAALERKRAPNSPP